jgi:hypothetical protein
LAINYYKTSTKPSNFTTTLAAVIVLDQLDWSDEATVDPNLQDTLLLMAYQLLLTSTFQSMSLRRSRKRQYMEDGSTLVIVFIPVSHFSLSLSKQVFQVLIIIQNAKFLLLCNQASNLHRN